MTGLGESTAAAWAAGGAWEVTVPAVLGLPGSAPDPAPAPPDRTGLVGDSAPTLKESLTGNGERYQPIQSPSREPSAQWKHVNNCTLPLAAWRLAGSVH